MKVSEMFEVTIPAIQGCNGIRAEISAIVPGQTVVLNCYVNTEFSNHISVLEICHQPIEARNLMLALGLVVSYEKWLIEEVERKARDGI